MQMLRALYSYRAFIAGSIVREFQAKYRNSLLGALWSILNPIAMIAVYTVIFSQIMRAKLPGVDSTFAYSIYLCSGILTWSLFSELTNRCINIFLDHANVIKKINFPRLCLPLIVFGSALLNFTIIFGETPLPSQEATDAQLTAETPREQKVVQGGHLELAAAVSKLDEAAGRWGQLPFDHEDEAAGDEERGDGHEHLKALGALLPEVAICLTILLAEIGQDALEVEPVVHAARLLVQPALLPDALEMLPLRLL